MIELLLFIASFVVTFSLTRQSLGRGVAAAITVGYFHGIIRANFVSPFTSFMFDGAILALYCGAYIRCPALGGPAWNTPLGKWMTVLVLWPAMMALVPINHPLIQLLAFHASVWFALMMMIGSQLESRDIQTIGRWIAILNLVALGFGIYLYLFGVPALYPRNEITTITYNSRDVADGEWRIPSTFLQAHAYGGAMLMSLPFLAAIGFDSRRPYDRFIAISGALAALGGLLLCGAREPLIQAAIAIVAAVVIARVNWRMTLAVGVAIGLCVFVASTDPRLQRVTTLQDIDMVQSRLSSSANSDFITLMLDYPFGAGMGSAWGMNIPSFLSQYAPNSIGMENEFSKILINMGIIGLATWVGFLLWFLCQIPFSRTGRKWPSAIVFAYSVTAASWLTAWLGAGTAAVVPAAAMMFLLLGFAAAAKFKNAFAVEASASPIPRPLIQAETI